MPTQQALQQRVRARKDVSDEEALSDSEDHDTASGNKSASEAEPSNELSLDAEKGISDGEVNATSTPSDFTV